MILICLNVISNSFFAVKVKVISNILRWHFYGFSSIISKHLFLAAVKRFAFSSSHYFPISVFCVHHLPSQLSPERLRHAQREHQSMEQRLRGLQQRPWWGGGGHDIWGSRPRWRGWWDDGPERPSHGAVCMQRPRGRVRGGRRQGGELEWSGAGLGLGLGSRFTALWLDVCLLNHRAECVIASRNESPWAPSAWCHRLHWPLTCTSRCSLLFLVEFSVKVAQAFCHGWKIWDC